MDHSADVAKPAVSIVTVSDYKAGEDQAWDALRQTLEGLAKQDFDGPVEYLLVEAEGSNLEVPPDLTRILSALKVIRAEGTTSYDLKNAGSRAASSDFVVMLDADCAPHPKWLSSVMEHRRRHPEAAAISGRTMYKTEGLLPRVFALLDRGYVDTGRAGPNRAISNNNGAFSREILMNYPLKNDVGPFGSKPQSDQILADGGELRFEPGMVVYHGYGGWEMAKEVRMLTGYAMARYRQINPDASRAWMYRIGPIGIPLIIGAAIVKSWFQCLKLHSHYGIKWYQLPVAWYVAVRVHLLEIPGLRSGMQGEPLDLTEAYR